MKTLITHLADYDLWANTRFVQRLAVAPAADLDRIAPSSFPTLRGTLLHIRDAENAWLCRLNGAPMNWPAEPSTDIQTLLPYCEQLNALVHAATEEQLAGTCEYRDLRGNVHSQPAWQMLLHVFNHSTQHRGQLITQMRMLGMEGIPANDLVAYQRSL